MIIKYRLVSARCSRIVAASLVIVFSFIQSTASAEPVPMDPNSLRASLETAGWKSLEQGDGTIYLFPADHPYAYLGQATNGEWTDIPPPNAKVLSAIVRQLEMQGYLPIVEIEFEDGAWEVEAYRHGKLFELDIDPVTGQITELSIDDG